MREELEEAIKRIKILMQDECNCEECIKDKTSYKTVLNYIDNSISKEVIEKKIEENNKLIKQCNEDEGHYGEVYIYEHDNKLLQELLEKK